jgi:tetratricopeptide (TPR) repeat protein
MFAAMAIAERKIILDQVRRLAAVPAGAAPEALIFYCARMLDGISAALVSRLGLKPSANIFSNLMTIEAHRLIDNVSKELAHTLRRMGNGVRHSLDDSTLDDTKLAIVLTREMVKWFENLEPGEEFQGAITRLDQQIDPDWGVVAVVALLERIEEGDAAAVEALFERQDDMLSSRFLATLCAEALIACGRATEAGALLSRCEAAFGSDQRYQQLHALVLSRTGKLDEAVAAADILLKRYPDDDETSGIAGGIYKRRWDRDPTQEQALKKAHELYRKQWEKGKKINAYLGVNAATTALYRGDNTTARSIAGTVVDAMDRRDSALAKAALVPQDDGVADYYDRVSRAEALLVAGKIDEARAAYLAAFDRYDHLAGNIGGTKAQATRIAATLHLQDFVL